jgi:hypothetical protein
MSFASEQHVHSPITPPGQIHVAHGQLSPWRSGGTATSLAPLDIEAAMALPPGSDKRTWTGYQSSETFWTDTAVERSRTSSVADYDIDSKCGKSVATSVRDLHTNHSGLSQMDIADEKGPPVPPMSSTGEPSLSFPHQIAMVVICCLAQFLNLAGMNQTVAPVMILSQYFDIRDYGTLSWFSAAYSMSVGTFILPAGQCHEPPLLYKE